MLNWDLWKVRRRLESVEKVRRESMDAAHKQQQSEDELASLFSSMSLDVDEANDEFRVLMTRKLVHEARSRLLPTPPREEDSDMWERGPFNGQWYLTNKGMTAVKQSLREDRVGQREPIITWGGLILGLIGAISGLAAILGARVG